MAAYMPWSIKSKKLVYLSDNLKGIENNFIITIKQLDTIKPVNSN